MAHNITVEEAALRLNKSSATVRRLLQQGAIPGTKLGGRWIVYGDKLAQRPASGGSQSVAAGGLDVEAAMRHVLRTDLRELWVPDILVWDDFKHSSAEVLAAASAKCATGQADPFEVVEVPKGRYLSRAGALLSLEDRVAYQALCGSFADVIEGELSDRVFSSRLDGAGARGFFKPSTQQWVEFRTTVVKEREKGSVWMVESDLVSYFETISHQILFEDLHALGVPEPVLRSLRSLLRQWRHASHHGLPTGSDASRLLGNYFLVSVDNAMLRRGFNYFRYMDDVRIIADTEVGALRALRTFEVLCRNRGLIVGSEKTRVLAPDDEDPSDDDKFDHADYIFKNGLSQSRAVLRELFKSAIEDESLKRRHAKFAIARLAAIVDRGILMSLLNRLDRLKEVSSDAAMYLRSFISERRVQEEITRHLNGPGEPGLELFQQSWLIAAMLETLSSPPREWVDYARSVAWDLNKPIFLRNLAMNLLVRGGVREDIEAVRRVAATDFNPSLVRGAAAALCRVGAFDKATQSAVTRRHSQLGPTVQYLATRRALPSLLQEGMWASVRS
ncbi:reverse transcriptase domain-containing protein [Gordonia sp. GONU]|uniref:Reverse transcriptase domain-containing protein n=1 Tax=Gordonia amicalis TaxID=89053 RepID=A0AAE4U768_9ACTN|nr:MULTISPECIES: reverse transcriptase domain-containing protein [Gordonia]MCR8899506.1 reverse transcriptase domain-containing protein [Gordonia sp. GONU]MCZ4652217.1 reverse transcriptase domain-containing protein [Gordonia amicalis]MDV6314280.1 reverse transcriptase domain-containing protein [Gordonia amicalis]